MKKSTVCPSAAIRFNDVDRFGRHGGSDLIISSPVTMETTHEVTVHETLCGMRIAEIGGEHS
jgi:hypothetical protein